MQQPIHGKRKTIKINWKYERLIKEIKDVLKKIK